MPGESVRVCGVRYVNVPGGSVRVCGVRYVSVSVRVSGCLVGV